MLANTGFFFCTSWVFFPVWETAVIVFFRPFSICKRGGGCKEGAIEGLVCPKPYMGRAHKSGHLQPPPPLFPPRVTQAKHKRGEIHLTICSAYPKKSCSKWANWRNYVLSLCSHRIKRLGVEGVSKNGQKKKVHKGGEAPFFASNPDPREYFWHIFMPLQVILLFCPPPSALGKYFPITVSKGGGGRKEREGGRALHC